MKIEDYALIGDTETAALVGRDGSIDWLCLPRFDSAACFAKLLGTEEHGRWRIAPMGDAEVTRRYLPDTLVLETTFTTDRGCVRVVDCMPVRGRAPDVVRVVEGVTGSVRMRMDLRARFEYGSVTPWIHRVDGAVQLVAGADAIELRSPVDVAIDDFSCVAEFDVDAGDSVPFVLTWHPSFAAPSEPIDAGDAIDGTIRWWREWAATCSTEPPWRDLVVRSLITLKALTYAPSGGIVAAPTTSLPELVGGGRNWDYRYCWLRDATFTLYALMLGGYEEEARSWRDWLVRAAAGSADQLQIMYGAGGERRLRETTVDWLPGYEGSTPVRIGNAATDQFQLDVFGEVMDCLYQARRRGLGGDPDVWRLQLGIMEVLEQRWRDPDEGIWEVRGPRRRFTYSRVMAWVAVDRAIRSVERWGGDGPVDRWRELRRAIHADVCTHGYDPHQGAFTQAYGRPDLDASLLLVPLVGFLPADDERVRGTVAAIERELTEDGFVRRYDHTDPTEVDGLPPGEGVFLPCGFWLVDNLVLQGRVAEARTMFDRLVGVANDVGLLSEEYDPVARRLVGNFPQALTHVALVNSAHNLGRSTSPARDRAASAGNDD